MANSVRRSANHRLPKEPQTRMACVDFPKALTARQTFTPLPPGSTAVKSTRLTEPSLSAAIETVRSTLGFKVTVTIMLEPLSHQVIQFSRHNFGLRLDQ